MGCSSDKPKILYDIHPKLDRPISLKSESSYTFNMDLIEKFLFKPRVREYFQKISQNLYFIDSNDVLVFSGLFETIKDDLINLFKRLKIDLIIPTKSNTTIHSDGFRIDYHPSTKHDLDFFIPLFLFEFSLYSESLINNTKLKSIIFVNSLFYSSDLLTNQYRAAVPDYLQTHSLYLCTKERNPHYIRNIIHHEFFHYVERAYDKTFGDEEWKNFNISGFEYGKDNYFGENLNEYKGFVSFCSLYGLEEDKAEIFSFLMTNPEIALGHTDSIINMKIHTIIRFLTEYDINGIGRSNKDYIQYLKNARIKLL
jgi:hypothetical protein